MKVRVISGHCHAPGRDVWPGEILDLPEDAARRKVAKGFAVFVTEEQAPPAPAAPAGTAGSEPEEPATEPEPASEEPAGEGDPKPGGRGRGRART
jgi:hypothetical protein